MDLEQRIQSLEEEVQILKNQIQATLLEIQEQLANQGHPGLHTTELPRVKETPAVKSVPATPAEDARPPKMEASVTPDDRTLPNKPRLEHLEKWASEKIEKIGAARTRELIRLYADEGRFDRLTRDSLLRFVAIYDTGEAPPEPLEPRKGVQTAKASEDAPRRTGLFRVAATSEPARPKRPTPAQAEPPKVKPLSPANERHEAPTAPRRTGLFGAIRLPEAAPAPVVHEGGEAAEGDGEQRTLVLKLIAGVQNAGAGLKRRKHG